MKGRTAGGDTATDLILKCKQGMQEAWKELYDLHKRDVFRLACAIQGDLHEAEDLTQSVFVKAFRSLDRFEGDESMFRAWLRRLTINTCISHRRKHRSGLVSYVDSVDTHSRECEQDGGQSGNRAIDLFVRKALDSLKAELRETIILHDICGYKHREIASIMSVKEGTVKSRLSEARYRMRQELAPYRMFLSGRVI
jgi:RNA polymerase sigma-70 factor (ECF subfamily)